MITREQLRDGQGPSDDIFEILVTTFRSGGPAETSREDLTWRPATDVYKTEDAFVVQMDLSGMDPAGIEVSTDGKTLVVRGTRRDIAPPGKKHYFTMEISVGPFARRIPIPVEVKTGTALARYRNGFLYVSFEMGGERAGRDVRRVDVSG